MCGQPGLRASPNWAQKTSNPSAIPRHCETKTFKRTWSPESPLCAWKPPAAAHFSIAHGHDDFSHRAPLPGSRYDFLDRDPR